jgi:hypothetical protein
MEAQSPATRAGNAILAVAVFGAVTGGGACLVSSVILALLLISPEGSVDLMPGGKTIYVYPFVAAVWTALWVALAKAGVLLRQGQEAGRRRAVKALRILLGGFLLLAGAGALAVVLTLGQSAAERGAMVACGAGTSAALAALFLWAIRRLGRADIREACR